ncbi:MAG: hypothetical protein OQK09_05915 [Colwellia sp.]|nr:hypothetical protein [Colwellia sp.]MCW8864808.1 hypothetical protein [Colwellia sp.]MCW9081031.1 hypothetical protein [Colwellia sp.]
MDTLSKLAIVISNPSKNDDYKLEQICTSTLELITHCNRVSLWVFSETLDAIHCLKCFESNSDTFSSGQHLNQVDFPEYFKKILVDEVLVASDARQHSATKCFNKLYFEPNNIFSLFDYVYHKDFEPRGIICCERVGEQVEWDESETAVLRRIANMMSMFF